MMHLSRILAVWLLVLSTPADAIDVEKAFDDPVLQARYEAIIEEVRCVQCQNQSIKDSNALIATDLRREIRRLMGEGMSDAEVYDFLVARYGEFVLYRPRMTGISLVLWIAPAVFLLIGAFVVARVLRKRTALPVDFDEETELGQATD